MALTRIEPFLALALALLGWALASVVLYALLGLLRPADL